VKRTLLVANDGGHLTQLHSLAGRFVPSADRLWATVPTEQTTSLLEGEEVVWMDPAPTRDWRAAVRNARRIRPLLAEGSVSRVVSTGSSLAVSALPQAAMRGISAHYIESVTRADAISLSGRMVAAVPWVHRYVQWPHLARGRWLYRGSVLDGFRVEPGESKPIRRLVVSLGTSSRYGFRRLVERLVHILPKDAEVLWQTGSTDVSGLGIEPREHVPARELEEQIAAADAIIAHAGAGIALTILGAGKVPVLVPRSAEHAEHVDDHQEQIARRLQQLDLAIVSSAELLEFGHLETSACRRAVREVTSSFALAGR
jgi:UDP-N-acetylglucosamine--N-acetylmuramyl-(pentapeptide) pyrophosphoryl-undecaprenol N-acetylglucosamine transferase